LTNDQFDEVEITEVSCFGAVPMKSGIPAAEHTPPKRNRQSAFHGAFVPSVIAEQPWPWRIPTGGSAERGSWLSLNAAVTALRPPAARVWLPGS